MDQGSIKGAFQFKKNFQDFEGKGERRVEAERVGAWGRVEAERVGAWGRGS